MILVRNLKYMSVLTVDLLGNTRCSNASDCLLSDLDWVLKCVLILTGSARCHQQPSATPAPHSGANQTEQQQQEEPDQTFSSPIIISHSLDTATENCMRPPPPASQGDIPNGTNTPRWSPESTTVESPADESRPLIGPPQETVELAVWSAEGLGETDGAAGEASDQGRCCCRCKCSQSGRLPAILSVLASLLCAAGMLYALYFYVPIRPPDCPGVSCRIIFTFCCCAVAALPMVLGTTQKPAQSQTQIKHKDQT